MGSSNHRHAAVDVKRLAGDVARLVAGEEKDRRRHLVEITPEGQVALEHGEDAIAVVEDQVLGSLSASERSSLQRLLAKAIDTSPT